MREADIERLKLKERFIDGVNPLLETESRLGLQLPYTRALKEAIHADLAEGRPHGIHWWEPKASASRAPRILISDYLYACTANVEHHLVAARLHYFEFVDWSLKDEQSRNERTQILSPGIRNDYPRSVWEYLLTARADAHRTQIVLSLASALDCMAATIVGVCAVPVQIKATQFGAIRKELRIHRNTARNPTVAALHASVAQDMASAIKQSGPTGWWDWLAKYRNALVHRGLRQETHALSDEIGLVDPDYRPVTVRETAHLPNHPGVSEIEAILVADPIGSIGLSENARVTLEQLTTSAVNLTERLSERLVDIWRDRREDPTATPQPLDKQWKQPDGREWSEFSGYAPGSAPIDPRGAIQNRAFRERLLAAALDDQQRPIWDEPNMRRFIPTAPSAVRVGTWNIQWDKKWEVPSSPRGVRLATSLAAPGCDVLCVTEGAASLLPGQDHIIDAGADWGVRPRRDDHRKVLLWSRNPWTDVDCVGSPDFPGGRFVKGLTETPIGPLTVVGVCIPWDGAHVCGGRKDRRRWEDHRAWLRAFERLSWRRTTARMVVLGDFNQHLPRTRASKETYEALLRAFDGLNITTAGAPDVAIDHIAHTTDLRRAGPIGIWPRRDSENRTMSDHVGVWVDFSLGPGT